MIPKELMLAVFLLALAGILMYLNIHTYRSNLAKRLTYWGMWAAIIASVVLALRSTVL